MHPDGFRLSVDAGIRRRPDRNVVCLDAMIFEDFLDRDPDRRAATPDGHQKRRLEPAAQDVYAELHGVAQQRFGGNEGLGNRRRCQKGPPHGARAHYHSRHAFAYGNALGCRFGVCGDGCLRRSAHRRAPGARLRRGAGRQRLQLVRLPQARGVERVPRENRHHRALQRVRFEQHARNQTPCRSLRV